MKPSTKFVSNLIPFGNKLLQDTSFEVFPSENHFVEIKKGKFVNFSRTKIVSGRKLAAENIFLLKLHHINYETRFNCHSI